MSYRHYIGCIKKTKLPKVLEKLNKLKSLNASGKRITRFLIKSSVELEEIGTLCLSKTNPIDDVLYANRKDDYSTEDMEFFFIDNDDKLFFKKLSYAYQKSWINYIKKCNEICEKIHNKDPLNEDDEIKFKKMWNTIRGEIASFENTGDDEIYIKNFEPFIPFQFNYLSAITWERYKDFDYDKYELCVFVY